MANAFTSTLTFLVNILFSLYLFAVMLRFFLQWVKADFYNPICQFLIKVTNAPLLPLRRLIPGFWGVDFAAIVLMFIIQCIQLSLLLLINGAPFSITLLIFWAVIKLLSSTLNLFFFAIIIRAVASWFAHNPYQPHPILECLYKLTEPLLKPARKWIKPISGVDLSPLAVLILLQIIHIFINSLI